MEKEKNFQYLAYIIIIVPIVILACLFGFLGDRFDNEIKDGQGVEIKCSNDYLHITGVMTRDSIRWNHIKSVSLLEKLPKGSRKGGGMITDEYMDGDIYLNEQGMVRMHIYKNIGLYIFIETDEEKYYLNLDSKSATQNLYDEIMDMLDNSIKS